MLSAEQIQANLERFYANIEKFISEPRATKLLALYQSQEELLAFAPASSKASFHNSFSGGYVDHVNRVVEAAIKVTTLWSEMGATINFSMEELVFAAINHDLGKIGSEEAEQYLHNDSEWHRKNQGKIYKHNPENPFLTVPDRGLFLLQQRGIKVSLNEYLGIKLHDGLYEEANKSYYISYAKESKLRTHLPILLHHADHMASRIEFEKWDKLQNNDSITKEKRKPNVPTSMSETQKDDLMNVFNTLFK